MLVQPFGPINELRTTNNLCDQLWQEFVMLRHQDSLKAYKNTASFIDQAKTYYIDAVHSSMRSSGLLYYYSFLNLSKALIVVKDEITIRKLNSRTTRHGINKSKTQKKINDLIDYEIEIYPQSPTKQTLNIFPMLYKVVTGNDWPIPRKTTIKLKEVLGYCAEIGAENKDLFNVEYNVMILQSILCMENDHEASIDVKAPKDKADELYSYFPNDYSPPIQYSDISEEYRKYWLRTLNLPYLANNWGFLQGIKKEFTYETGPSVFSDLVSELSQKFNKLAIPTVYSPTHGEWLFVPEITLSGTKMKWHPILSDYLMAFVLSTILRYQPYVLKDGTKSNFLAEAWCSQSPLTTLRYFLMFFASTPRRIANY